MDRLGSDLFIVLYDAHFLEGHETTVRIGIHHFFTHLFNAFPLDNEC